MSADPMGAVLGLLEALVGVVGKQFTAQTITDMLARRRVNRAIDVAIDQITEDLQGFLDRERVAPEHRALVLGETERLLRPLLQQPERLFQGSLDGQRIFDELTAVHGVPEAISDEGLAAVWGLFVPRVTTLLVGVTTSLKDWQREAWREHYRRMDEVVAQLRQVSAGVDAVVQAPRSAAEQLLEQVLRLRRQRRGLRAELAGLGDAAGDADLDAMYVAPALRTPEVDERGRRRGYRPQQAEDGPSALRAFLARGARSVVVAGPGAGKTTWTLWMERHGEADLAGTLVVRVALRTTPRPLPSLLRLLQDASGVLAEHLTADATGRWIADGRVSVIVDGLDELVPEQRDDAVMWLQQLSSALGDGALVVTTRPLATDHVHELAIVRFQRWQIEAFDEPRVRDYIARWYQHAPFVPDADRGIDSAALAQEWSQDPTLRELTGNPLLLSTLLTVHHMEGRLPSGRAALYRKYIDGMLGTWDGRRKIEVPRVKLEGSARRRVLRDLAIQMVLSGRDALEQDAIVELAKTSLRGQGLQCDARAVLDDLRERSGLLIGPGTWNFAHKSVAEFLTAEAIVEGNVRGPDGQTLDRSWLMMRRHQDRFNVVIFLWAGLVPAADLEAETLRLVAGDNDDQDLGYGLALDQFDRFDGAAMRQVAVLLERNLELVPQFQFAFWGSGKSLTSPDRRIRSVRTFAVVSQLVTTLLTLGYLNWANVAAMKIGLRALIWLHAPDSPLFGGATPQRMPLSNNQRDWLILLAWVQLRTAPASSGNSLPSTVTRVATWLPNASAVLPLMLMSIACEGKQSTAILSRLVAVLSSLTAQDGDSWLLQRSKSANIPGRSGHLDILTTFSALLDTHAVSLPPDALAAGRRYVEHLVDQRTRLPPELPDKEQEDADDMNVYLDL